MGDLCKRKWNIALWIAAAVWCGVLFFFSGQPGEISERESMNIVHMLLKGLDGVRGKGGQVDVAALSQLMLVVVRKLAHVAAFIIQGLLLGGALMTRPKPLRRSFAWAVIGCAIIGVLNELHQSIVPGRECKFTDMLINAAGGAIGALLAMLLWLALRRRRQKPTQKPML